MDEGTKQILEIVSDIQENMMTKNEGATKADLSATEVRLISEIQEIRNALEYLKEHVDSMSGYAKEIDTLMERINTIEKNLNPA